MWFTKKFILFSLSQSARPNCQKIGHSIKVLMLEERINKTVHIQNDVSLYFNLKEFGISESKMKSKALISFLFYLFTNIAAQKGS